MQTRSNKALAEYTLLEQNTFDWEKARLDFDLTGSNMANAVGIGYSSKVKYWKIKTGKAIVHTGHYTQRILEYGKNNEGNAIQSIANSFNVTIEETGIWPIAGTNYGVSPDGLIFTPKMTPHGLVLVNHIVVEVKCPWTQQIYSSILSEKPFIPNKHYIQVMAEIISTQTDFCYYCCWTPYRFVIMKVYRNDEAWNEIIKHLTDFMDCVHKDEQPKRTNKKLLEEQFTKYQENTVYLMYDSRKKLLAISEK